MKSFLAIVLTFCALQSCVNCLQCPANLESRFDCYPESLTFTQAQCESRGCCYDATKAGQSSGPPACYFGANPPSYDASSIYPIFFNGVQVGWNATLSRTTTSAFPNDVKLLQMVVTIETETRLRLKIFDPKTARYEVPLPLGQPEGRINALQSEFAVDFNVKPFSITILRASDGKLIFDSQGMAPLIFADQYIQFSTKLSSSMVYGLGEHRSSLLVDTQWQKRVFWTNDHPVQPNVNIYGSHPFYLNLEPSLYGNSTIAHGVFLLNSNAMQTDLQPYENSAAITYRTTGGILDFFLFSGPSPDQVVEQYTKLIGRPTMPPFWGMGFHLCRWGYGGDTGYWQVIERNRAAGIPYDVQWNDMTDYAINNETWTLDKQMYGRLPAMIKDLHEHGQHNVINVDPAVASFYPKGTFPPFDMGVEMDAFVKNESGQTFIGKAWPGLATFVDFFSENGCEYWYKLISTFHDVIEFDGIWLDMNEPSNFGDGSIYNGCPKNNLNNPPFVPPGIDGGVLYSNTVCPSAKQGTGLHYNLHNLYGWSETRCTAQSLRKYFNKRAFVIPRSTAPGTGLWSGHWSGDNTAKYEDAYYSISEIINMNMFGVPFTGADICGFNGNSYANLCIRWMQLGSFYPFMRNHANGRTVPQDPGYFNKATQDAMRPAMLLRYTLLPYMYTRLYISQVYGTPAVRPLFFDYMGTEKLDTQFQWGQELLVSPVLVQNATSVNAFIPVGTWYDVQTLEMLNLPGGQFHNLSAPIDKINVHVRGGSILPTLPQALTTTKLREGKFNIVVAPDLTSANMEAKGTLFWDDGESLDTVSNNNHSIVNFIYENRGLSNVIEANYYGPVTMGQITILGVKTTPQLAMFNDKTIDFNYNADIAVLSVVNLSYDLRTPFTLTWK